MKDPQKDYVEGKKQPIHKRLTHVPKSVKFGNKLLLPSIAITALTLTITLTLIISLSLKAQLYLRMFLLLSQITISLLHQFHSLSQLSYSREGKDEKET